VGYVKDVGPQLSKAAEGASLVVLSCGDLRLRERAEL
jgi:hypothetical protein